MRSAAMDALPQKKELRGEAHFTRVDSESNAKKT
jgi:hypothetical protein